MAKKKEVVVVVEKVEAIEASGEQPEQSNDLSELDALISAEESVNDGGDYNPAEDEQADKVAIAENKAAEAAANGQAMVAVAIIGEVIAMIRPDLAVGDKEKMQVQQKLAPVLLKYSTGGVPPWLLKYREELELAGALGFVGFGMFQQIKAAEAANDQQGVDDGEQSESQAS